MNTHKSSYLSHGFSLIFSLAFASAGYFFTSAYVNEWWQWYQPLLHKNPQRHAYDWSLQLSRMPLAYFFSAIGGLLLYAYAAHFFHQQRIAKLQKTFPDEPWKHRITWTSLGLADETDRAYRALSILTFATLVFLGPHLHALLIDRPFLYDPKSYIAWLPFVLWCLLAYAALRRLRHRCYAGRCYLVWKHSPVMGALAEGEIHTSNPIDPHETILIDVQCIKLIQNPKRQRYRSQIQQIIWQQAIIITPEMRLGYPRQSTPFTLTLPEGLPTRDVDWHILYRIPVCAVHARFTIFPSPQIGL